MSSKDRYGCPGIADSGAIATGLAAVSTTTAETILLACSEASAWRAEEGRRRLREDRMGPALAIPRHHRSNDLCDCDVVIEEVEPKREVIAAVAAACPNADLTTTTTTLSIAEIAEAAGTDKLWGLHVFNPVPRNGHNPWRHYARCSTLATTRG